jgi:folate-dependent phosphoribosylglycinamide formyltransferase PurN
MKIAFCHLDSLSCLPALNVAFDELGEQIGLVVTSTRFGSKHGTFWQQMTASIRRYGLGLTVWLGFDLISVPIVARFARLLGRLTGRRPGLATLPELAARHGATLLPATNVNAEATLAVIEAYAPDLIVVMNFDQILQPPLIALARLGVLNVHPSLLPALRGPCPAIWALAQRRPISGATIHAIEDETIDAGPILAQQEVAIAPGQSVAQANAAFFLAGAFMLRPVINAMAANRTSGRSQCLSHGQYLGFPTRADMVEFRRSGRRLCRLGDALRLLVPALGIGSYAFGDRPKVPIISVDDSRR